MPTVSGTITSHVSLCSEHLYSLPWFNGVDSILEMKRPKLQNRLKARMRLKTENANGSLLYGGHRMAATMGDFFLVALVDAYVYFQ